MSKTITQPLKAFLCHASGDKPAVREMYKRLVFEGVDAWLDKEKLLPGQDWRVEIPKAVQEADVVIVFLSKKSVSKEGYVQKEIKFALDIAEEKPEGTIFLIPARLEECLVPERLSRWQWVDLFEDNGFVQLLRSLKLRARAVGATVEPASYEDTDRETAQRVEQLYTEGLAAFYTEDWDRACQRFRTILSEQPGHKNAAEKLAEAEKQRSLTRLYARAEGEYKAENWQAAIQSLEGLLEQASEYKDVAHMLKNAKKKKRLGELYIEAKALHMAQKWQAVTKVFEQIYAIDPACSDPDSLLLSAQKEVAELKRIADLNDQYSLAVRRMDAGQWLEARTLLEKIHKSQTGFLETERLLRKVEDEITKAEEQGKRRDQANLLYEQAHGLIRSRNWRKVLDKMEEIQQLDSQFEDKDGIAEKAKSELVREEQEIQRQNKLAAMYAESVRLMQEGKYQEALDKWNEVLTVDPKYPDRQWVQRTAHKKLTPLAQPKLWFSIPRWLWMAVGALIVIGFVFLLNAGKWNLFPVTINQSAPTVDDNFNSAANENGFDKSTWQMFTREEGNTARQNNGSMVLVSNGYENSILLLPLSYTDVKLTTSTFIEASVRLSAGQNGGIGMQIATGSEYVYCHIWGMNNTQSIYCGSPSFTQEVETLKVIDISENTWHTIRMEFDPAVPLFSFYIDRKSAGKLSPKPVEKYKSAIYDFYLWSGCGGKGCIDQTSPRVVKGYYDYVKIGTLP